MSGPRLVGANGEAAGAENKGDPRTKVTLTLEFYTDTKVLDMMVSPAPVAAHRDLLYAILGLAHEAVTMRGLEKVLDEREAMKARVERPDGEMVRQFLGRSGG